MQSVIINGVERFLGYIPTPPEKKKLFRPASDVVTVIPESEYREISNRHFVDHILDQDGQGACTAFASAQALMIARALQGLPYTELSAGALYGMINGGSDSGSNPGDALDVLQSTGTCLASTIGQLEWKKARKDTSWKTEAKDFRVLEAFTCDSVDLFFSGLVQGFVGVYCVGAGNSFATGSDGWLKPYDGTSINHCVGACGLTKHPSKGWGVDSFNSWADSWGDNGFYKATRDWIDVKNWQEMWLIRSTLLNSYP